MKTVRVTLTERRAAEVEAALAAGEFDSVSDLVDAALGRFLAEAPDEDQLLADIDDFLARRAAGEQPIPGGEAFEAILADLRR
jgi:Arc/MetJ-type ribon-helix-helix transcriptional regulator